jgi:DNA-binding CsgD family transcriptional regulator
VLVLTPYGDREYILRFLKAVVSGYLLKKAVGSDLIAVLKAIVRGEPYLYSSIASEVVAGYLHGDREACMENPYDKLSDREKQVLKLVAEGQTHKEVADMLSISVKTVIARQTNIGEKLGIHTRAALIKFAIQKGIIKIEMGGGVGLLDLPVHHFAHFLACLEEGDLLRGNGNGLAGLGISSLFGTAVPDTETPESPDFHLIVPRKSVFDAVEHGVDDHFHLFSR